MRGIDVHCEVSYCEYNRILVRQNSHGFFGGRKLPKMFWF